MEESVFIVSLEDVDKRIDKYLSEKIEGKSRAFIQGLIQKENVHVNNKSIKSNYKLKVSDTIKIDKIDDERLMIEPENIPLNILYEDNDLIVINKEKGMVVHPATGNYNKTLVNGLLYHCKELSDINGLIRAGIVHRIDKDTTGVLVVAKNNESHIFLANQLKEHSMKREYLALIEGNLKDDKGIIDKPLGRNKKDRLKVGVVEGGKKAITHYEVLERFKGVTLLRCALETGRTHQIRVHMASIGHPLLGDMVYGFKKQKFKVNGQLLHARVLGFIHPRTKEYMEFSADLPNFYKDILNKLRKEVG